MQKSLYDCRDYRDYLKGALPISGEGRGSRNRLAEALNCNKGFISQVLGGSAHFSLEHAARISRFLNHDPEEREFFLLLVHLGRSGSKDLGEFYQTRMREILEKRKQIKERIRVRADLSEADQIRYYSSWHYTAIHMCLMVPELRTRKAMIGFLGISKDVVYPVLDFFVERGIAETRGNEFWSGPTRIHLPANSPLISKHHTNWRMRAITSLDQVRETDLHYSSVMSLSEESAAAIRAALLNAIQSVEPVIKSAKDETVYTLNMDLFSLKN